MSRVKVSGNVSGTGTLTLSAPDTNTDRTLTLPDSDGTLLTKTAGENFSLYEDTGTTAKFFWDASTESLGIGTTSPASALHVIGDVTITQAPGKYTIDTSGGATTIANGGTVDFPLASGMLIVNNYTSGKVTMFLCGGGATVVVANTGLQVGTFTYQVSIGGYRWTNNYGSAATFGFFFVRTRTYS